MVDRRHLEDALMEHRKQKTWISTDSASITKIPPIRISSTAVLVMIASPAIAPPSPSEPVSPMKMLAGKR